MQRQIFLALCFLLLCSSPSHAGPMSGGQPRDSDLSAIANLVCADGKVLKKASGVWSCQDDAGAGGGAEPSDGDKTDITVTGGTVWVIDADAVTNAKLANMATATIKGRDTAGTGDPEDLTAAEVATLLDAEIATQSELSALVPATATALATNPTDCNAGQFAHTIAANGALTCSAVGLATTASALAANGGNCSAGQAPLGIDATGVVEGCFAVQASDADLTTLGAKTLEGTGDTIRFSSGAFDQDDCVKVDGDGNFVTAGAACGSGGEGGGDFSSNTATSIDSELLLFSGTGGKTGKRATTSGVLKGTSGVLGAATQDDLSAPSFCADAGSTDAYACTLAPAITGYTTGSHYWFKANTGSTGASTIAFNGLAAKTIKKLVGGITTDLADDDIRPGQMVHLIYDGTNMQMLSPLGNIPGGITPLASADCANQAMSTLQTCIQDGVQPLFFYCSHPDGCEAGESVLVPPADTDTVGAETLQEAWQGGKQIVGVNSLGNGVVFCADLTDPEDGDCDDVEDQSITFYCDAATGCQTIVKPDGDMNVRAPTGFDVNLMLGSTTHVRLNQASGKLDFLNTGQPLKSIEVTGKEFGSCAYTEEVVAASKPTVGVFTCTDSDSDGFDFDFMMPLNWNAGTVTVRINAYNVAASPAGNLVLSCSGQAVSDNDVIANRATTGEQTVTLGFATQYREEQATSAAITLTGTPGAGDHVYMHCDVDATGTTTNASNTRINAAAKVFFTTTSTSE